MRQNTSYFVFPRMRANQLGHCANYKIKIVLFRNVCDTIKS